MRLFIWIYTHIVSHYFFLLFSYTRSVPLLYILSMPWVILFINTYIYCYKRLEIHYKSTE
ncbi:hypothetical protein BDF14DRAFT_1766339 [Spinellus fusiger]|nr:hypothetical protein BDF14DRAFT_1766339 [Spinellus fusiger]